MGTFLETYSFPKLNQEETENLNNQKQLAKLKQYSKNHWHKSPGPDSFTDEFYQTLKELTPVLLKLFQKIQEKGRLSKLFLRDQYYPDPKTR